MNRVILVDGSNLYASNRELGFTIDYKKVLNYFAPVHRAVYFTAMAPKEEQSTLRPMVDYLDFNNWCVEQKEYKEFLQSDGRTEVKGNMDVEIAVTAMAMADKMTDLILFSGDGDFVFLTKTLQARGIRVTVVSTKESRPSMIAEELRRAADTFIDLVDLQPHIKRSAEPAKKGFSLSRRVV